MFKLRDRSDLDDRLTTLATPPSYLNLAKDAVFNNSSIELDPAHKSVSPYLSFWDFHEAYTQSKTTPTEMAQKLLIQLKKSKHMNWMKLVCNDILEQAEESTRRYQSSKPLSQLDGVFVTVKEELYVKGLEAKAGTHFVNDRTPAVEDAAMVLKLRNAGAIIIGSTVMSELGWDTFSINPYTITPKNPHALSHSCGGSCGGSGGSVGGGLAPISVGSDGGGSLRVPAAFCGAYGLKATYARISGHAGSSLDPSVGAYGSLSATADDMALTYSITAGPDLKDPNTLLQPAVNLKNYDRYLDLSDLTIATTPEWNKSVVEPAILEQLNVFKAQLERLGARFVEIDIPDLDVSSTAHQITICSELLNFSTRHMKQRHSFAPQSRIMVEVASQITGSDYVRAQQVRTLMMNHMRGFFEDQKIDLILTPTTAVLSPNIPAKAHAYGMSKASLTIQTITYCTLANVTGIPAVTVPAGFHKGLPIGLQFMSAWWNEALLCRIAKSCERLPGIERKRPEAWYGMDF